MEEAIISGIDYEDIDPVMIEARILALDAKHGFVNLDHFFVAMLKTNCLAKVYLTAFDIAKNIAALQKLYPNTGKQGMKDSLPLTIHLARIIKHANHIA
jgi:hypothetical protein